MKVIRNETNHTLVIEDPKEMERIVEALDYASNGYLDLLGSSVFDTDNEQDRADYIETEAAVQDFDDLLDALTITITETT